MADSNFRGPVNALGALMGAQGGAQQYNIEPWDGPSFCYQGDAFPDVRYAPANKDGMGVGRVPSFGTGGNVMVVDGIPSTLSTTAIAAAQAVTANTPMTLVTVAPGGGGAGVPSLAPVALAPSAAQTGAAFPNSGAIVNVLALDFGFTTGTTVAGNQSVTVPDSTRFAIGQWICIGGAGNSAKTASLFTQVVGSADATHITVFPAPSGALTNAPIGNVNFNGPFPQGFTPTSVQPYMNGGMAAIFNPAEALARAVNITGNTGSTAQNFTVRGYDVYGMPMSEVIAFAGGAVTTAGKKAFKYIASVTPATTDAGHTLSVGTTDVYGFPLRSDQFGYAEIVWNNTYVTANTGYTAATVPASGDVRGTYAVQSQASNNSARLTIVLNLPPYQMLGATPVNPALLFGAAQT